MTNEQPILFLYPLRGEDCLWAVVDDVDDVYLCRVVEGIHEGIEARFCNDAVVFGQMRYSRSASADTCG